QRFFLLLERNAFGNRSLEDALRALHFQFTLFDRDGHALRDRYWFLSNARHKLISDFQLPITNWLCLIEFHHQNETPNRQSAIGNRQCSNKLPPATLRRRSLCA